MDVAEWWRGLGLDQYLPAFLANDIDGKVLRRLTAEDLRELGVASIGHRRRLLDAIATLGPLPNPPPQPGRAGWGLRPKQSGGNSQLCSATWGLDAVSTRF